MARVARLGERVESGVLAPCSSDKGCICNEWTYKRLLFTFALTARERHFTLLPGDSGIVGWFSADSLALD